jgi:hypothetical protein
MKLSDIKRGDILVAEYGDANEYKYERDYIIFIASGSKICIGTGNMNYTSYIIPAIASIDLSNMLNVNRPPLEYGVTVGFTVYHKDTYERTEIRKPTVDEVLDILKHLREFGYKYNKKTKNIEKL